MLLLIGGSGSGAHASAVLSTPVFDHCVKAQCLKLTGKTGHVAGKGYLMENATIATAHPKLRFLDQAVATKVVVDFENKVIKLYGAGVEEMKFDASIELDTLRLLRLIRL